MIFQKSLRPCALDKKNVCYHLLVMHCVKCDDSSSLNPLILTEAKSSQTILIKSCSKCIVRKIFDGEMLIRTYPTTLPEMFCKIILNFKVMVKSSLGPEDYLLRNS